MNVTTQTNDLSKITDQSIDLQSTLVSLIEKLNEAIALKDILAISKLKQAFTILCQIRPEINDITQSRECHELIVKCNSALKEWLINLKVGDGIEIFNPRDKKFFKAKLIEHRQDHKFLLHYSGWQKRFDEVVDISEEKYMIQPLHTFYPRLELGTKKKRKFAETESEDNDEADISSTNIQTSTESKEESKEDKEEEENNEVIKEMSRTTRSNRKSAVKKTTSDISEITKDINKTSKGRVYDAEKKDHNDWICGICGFFEARDDTDLVLCEGLCKRSFHVSCLDTKDQPEMDSSLPWYCANCLTGRHACNLCGVTGEHLKDIFKCAYGICGKFYHVNCLEANKNKYKMSEVINKTKRISPDSKLILHLLSKSERDSLKDTADEDDMKDMMMENGKNSNNHTSHSTSKDLIDTNRRYPLIEVKEFLCPLHYCDTCHDEYRHLRGEYLYRCNFCPKAYHLNCIEPGSRFNAYCLICPKHPEMALFDRDSIAPPKPPPSTAKLTQQSNSFEEDSSEMVITSSIKPKQLQNLKASVVKFWNFMILPEDMPDPNVCHDNHFKMLQKMKFEVENQWKVNYSTILKNDYEFVSKNGLHVESMPSDCRCECVDVCGPSCLNRILRLECFGDKDSPESICNVGPTCSNRTLQTRLYPRVEVFKEFSMGWGLRAAEIISEGSLVIEYLGEIINYKEVLRRMGEQRKNTPHDKDFYIMDLNNGWYVDGKKKGNVSRFINHSCNPNCELQQWMVKDGARIGIFALRDIKEGEPLSYDYQFDTNEQDIFQCYCGAQNCRGTMAPKKKNSNQSSAFPLTKADRNRLIAIGKSKVIKSASEMMMDELSRCYTSNKLPGDNIHEIKNGPNKSYVIAGMRKGCLLGRNIRAGSNIMKRRNRMFSKKLIN